MKKDDIGVFSTYPVKIDNNSMTPYCIQFYTLMFGDAFGDMEIIAKYFDESGALLETLSLGIVRPEEVMWFEK